VIIFPIERGGGKKASNPDPRLLTRPTIPARGEGDSEGRRRGEFGPGAILSAQPDAVREGKKKKAQEERKGGSRCRAACCPRPRVLAGRKQEEEAKKKRREKGERSFRGA